jgi:hypothetical protein
MAVIKSAYNLPNGSGGYNTHHFETEVSVVVGLKEKFRQPSTAYAVGNIAYHNALPTGWYLECTTAGTTGGGDLTISSPSIGGTVSDGTVVWTVRKNASTQDLTGYLPLSGGAMTGAIIERSVNDSSIFIVGGNTNTPGVEIPGARLALMGMDRTDNAGDFFLQAYDKATNTIKQLHGKPDGKLSWRGNDLAGSAIVAKSLGTNGYIKYANGLIIQWGVGDFEDGVTGGDNFIRKAFLFPIPFSSTNYSFTCTQSNYYTGLSNYFFRERNTNSIQVYTDKANPYTWIAIGY